MEKKLERLEKKSLVISSLFDEDEEKKYWLSRSKAERLNAIELNRKMVYGQDRIASRFQRFFEVAQLVQS